MDEVTEGGSRGTSQESVASLRAVLADDEARRTLIDAMGFGALLSGSILDHRYTTPDTLASPIVLTPLGKDVARTVAQKNSKLKPNDIKVCLFITTGCSAGVFVDPTTDMDGLRAGLTLEMKKGRILFPYIFGRDLHDQAAKMFPRKFELNNDESLRLLRQLPVGVFQDGYTTTGPFGALRGGSPRALSARTVAPGYLCSDTTCPRIHSIVLNTAEQPSRVAAVNRAMQYVSDYVRKHYGNTEDLHVRHLEEAAQIEMDGFRIAAPEATIEVLADTFDKVELASVVDLLLREGLKLEGLREWSTKLNAVISNPTDYARSLSRAEMLQIVLLFTDSQIEAAVDKSVLSGTVPIRPHELRERRVRRFSDNGAIAQVGPRGVRLTGNASFVAARIQELLHHLYFDANGQTSEDLRYLLGLDGSPDIADANLIDKAVQTMRPDEILQTLVLGSRRTHVAACEYLNIDPSNITPRSDAVSAFLWKLGAPTNTGAFGELESVARYCAELDLVADSSDNDAIRGTVSNLFASVESALRISLEFCTWALTHDHFVDDQPFLYDPAPDAGRLEYIETHAPTLDDRVRLDTENGANTLIPLGSGFARLAKSLSRSSAQDYTRPLEQVPHECRKTGRPFVFEHTLPFHDLTEPSREGVISELQSCSRIISDAIVLRVRNAPIHGVSEFPSVGDLRHAASRLSELRSVLVRSGLYPAVYDLTLRTGDTLGRVQYDYTHGSASVRVTSPSWAIAPMLPTNVQRLVVMRSLQFPSAGVVRFALQNRPGRDPYWEGWPKRWETTSHYGRGDSAANAAADAATDLPGAGIA